MSTPVWSTTAGKLASIDEQVSYSLQLEANTADSTAITYSVIAGSLPSGMELTSTGLLTGIPAEVSKRTRYTFVVRATAGTTITDRNFYLDIEGADAPTFTTATVSAGGIYGGNTAPTYTKPTVTSQEPFNDFFESGSLNPFDDSDPGALTLTSVSPSVPSLTSVTFTSVDTSLDMKKTTVYVTSLGSKPRKILDSLTKNRIKIQKSVSSQLDMKYTPRVTFKMDPLIENVEKINQLLNSINNE